MLPTTKRAPCVAVLNELNDFIEVNYRSFILEQVYVCVYSRTRTHAYTHVPTHTKQRHVCHNSVLRSVTEHD